MSDPEGKAANQSLLAWWAGPRRWPFWVCIMLLAYTLGGFFGAPWLLERIATRKVAELERTLRFSDIKVNPFLLTLQLQGAELHDTDGAMLVSWDDYFINLQASSLFRWAWTFREIRLAGLRINYERFGPGDDRYVRLLDSLPPPEQPEPDPANAGLVRVVIDNLQVSDASMLVTDHLEHGSFDMALGPINVTVMNLSTLPDMSGQQEVEIITQSGGQIAWQGSLQLTPLHSAGKVTVKGRLLSDLDHYLVLFTNAQVTGEGLDWNFDYRIGQAANGSLAASIENLDAEFANWQLFPPDDPEPLLGLPLLRVSDANLQWPQQTLDIAAIELQQPRVSLSAAADGSLNLDQLLAEFAPGEPSAAAEEPVPDTANSSAWDISVARFGIEEGAVSYHDASTEPAAELGLQAISLAVTEINNQPGSSLPVEAAFTVASGGSGTFSGQVVALPEFSASGKFGLEALQLAAAQPWVNGIARLTVNSGSLSLDGDVEMNAEQPGAFRGSVRLEGLDVNDQRQHEKLVGWERMVIDRVEVDLAANTVKTSELELSQPYGRLQIAEDKTTNLDGLVLENAAETSAATAEAEAAASPAITIAGFDIDQASLDFSDLSLPLPFVAAIRSLDGNISTLATDSETPARVELEGQVNEFGLARINGSLDAWDPTGFTDIQMTFRNLEMQRITPYTIEFAGWEIDEGRMDLDLDYKINQGQLNGSNDIVIREMTVGDKVENSSGTSLPLKFAVALLKDSNGVIDVDLPVEGDMNDPSFRISGIVWRAIGNLLVKVATAPFRLLGSLVGVDSEDFGTLHFRAGKAEISPPDREQLLKLAEAMRLRPELRLDVAGTYSPEVDRLALQAQRVDERVETAVSELPGGSELATGQRRQVMEQMLAVGAPAEDLLALQQQHSSVPAGEDPEKTEPVLDEAAYLEALRQALIEAEPVGEPELQALAQARADAIATSLAGDGGEAPLPVVRLEPSAVEADENGDVPLELKVEAAPE